MVTSDRRKQLTQPTDGNIVAYLDAIGDPVKRHDAEQAA